ncbi:MAG: hypothetical protein HYS05_08780 [Acidobacteria bacterium]|nr:hypothetical protein [Acidobacteriota bacterium]
MRTWLLAGAAVCLVVLGFARMPPTASLYGDALSYVSMAEHGPTAAIAPFRYRVLVPLLAGLIPLPAPTSLLMLSVAALITFYLLTLATSIRLGASAPVAFGALVAVFLTFWHQYNFHNPYLTDAFQLASLAAMVFALVIDSFSLFAAAAVMAVAARETSIVFVPAWFLLKDRGRGAAIVLASAAVAMAPRLWYADGTPLVESMGRAYRASGGSDRFPWVFARRVYDAYGLFWWAIGIAVLANLRKALLMVSFALLFAGALLASIIAVDTGRMFEMLAPVIVPALALAVQSAGSWLKAPGSGNVPA